MSSPTMIPRPRRRRSLAGPVILILVGLLFLLKNMGMHIELFGIFARWWPVLLIVAGVVKIVETYQADQKHRKTAHAPWRWDRLPAGDALQLWLGSQRRLLASR